MSSKLTGWVADQLYDILGYSESNIEQYIISLAKNHVSAEEDVSTFITKLETVSIPNNSKTRNFAEDLLSRIPRKTTKKIKNDRERETVDLLRKNESFELISMEEEDSEEKKKKKKKRKLRQKEEESEETEEIEQNENTSKKQKVLTEEELKEQERILDQKEKEEFANRMLDKYKNEGKNKKKLDPEIESRQQILRSKDSKEEALEKKRLDSRFKYLGDREQFQMEVLEQEVQELREMKHLSEKQKQRLRIQEEALAVRKKIKSEQNEPKEKYEMPQSYYDEELNKANQKDRFSVLKKKFVEKERVSENQQWEKTQLQSSKLNYFENQNAQRDGKHYEFVLDPEIEFVATETMKGDKIPDSSLQMKKEQSTEMSLSEIRKTLPIYEHKETLLQAIHEYQILILVGETGSGKSTQVVQYLRDAGYCKNGKKIGCTQPRRVAAMSVAARVAKEASVKLGNEVGYSIRFEDCTTDKTVIKFMTDGMMLREFLGEPDMASYSVIIIDEAHERSLHTDILFGLVKDVARFRPDIKIIIASATLEAKKMSDYFDQAPTYYVPGRKFPVDILYTKAPESNYLEAAVVTVLHTHMTQPDGDILVFLTGQEEIETAEEMLIEKTKGAGSKMKELRICPIYSTLPSDMQVKIFEKTPKGARKVVLATNIAETSLTIPDIIYVIDCGYCKQTSYNPRTGMESLVVVPISKAAANQRSGRSGRTQAGKCFRLYTSWSYQNELEENFVPEIQRTNLANVVLMLKSLGINDLINFDFMDPPPVETLIAALEHLYALGALNDKGELTKLGRRMAELPIDPMLSKMLLASEKYECSEEIATICAMLSVNNAIFFRPKDKAVHADNARKNLFQPGGDHLTLMHIYNEWSSMDYSTNWCNQNFIQPKSMKRAKDIRDQLIGLMERVEVQLQSSPMDDVKIRKAITAGFFYNTAILQKSGQYKTYHKPQTVNMHPNSALFELLPKWVIYYQLAFTSKEFMRQVIEIDPKWLIEIAPHIYKDEIEESTRKMPIAKGRSQKTE
eukprot:gene9015-1114_t